MALVHQGAIRYAGKGLNKEEGVQEGVIGLMHAITKYDPTMINERSGRPYTFGTYASYWIHNYLFRALERERTWCVHVPEHALMKASAQHRRGGAFSVVVGGEEIKLGRFRHPASLEAPLDEDGDFTIGGMLADETTPEYTLEQQEAKRFLSDLLTAAKLTEREAQVLGLRFGVLGYGETMRMPRQVAPSLHHGIPTPLDGIPRARTLVEVGQTLGVCRERVRQIEEHALAKVRGFAQRSSRFRRDVADVFATLDAAS